MTACWPQLRQRSRGFLLLWLDAAGFKGHIAAVAEEDVEPAEAHEAPEQRPEIRWGVGASVLLHVPLIALLIFGLPKIEPKPPEDESVKVELVPPPEEKKPEEKKPEKPPEPKPPEQAKKQPPPSPPPPPAPPPPPSDAVKPEPSTPMQSISHSVPEFADKDTAPEQKEQALPRHADAPKPSIADVKPASAPVEPPQPEKSEVSKTMPAANAVPQDIELPQVQIAEVNAEKTEPDGVRLDEARTNLEQAEHPKETAPTPPVTAEAKVSKSEELTEAKILYSEKATADPMIRNAIKNLPRAARINVLCQTELQQQLIHAPEGYKPDFLPSFPRVSKGNILNGTGGAFQSSGWWYDVTLICQVDNDARKVISFRFDVGDKIPKSQWKSRGFLKY
ncbi:hypothetical protein B5E41_05895 [Rhizobium esperanzae]|uniref:DUF930 domain-containing protein n=1 Tax=Rhizobium esperanzae TaxID=1967781 RepID=A0A2D0ABF4_9HYPH|nr:DUF930 domain-containing protein [Rhizobium esperanzae]OWO96180.1 hypothetical protein B5E41_05895 [Rhizobium esperanzae]